jgi:hypothetical protein
MQDYAWFSRTLIEKLANLRRPPGADGASTELRQLAERDILGLVCHGGSPTKKSPCSSGSRLARNHVATIYRKIDAHRRSAAIVWARKQAGANVAAVVMHLHLSAGTKTDHLPL